MILTTTELLLIDLYSIYFTNSRSRDRRTPLGLLVNDDDRRQAIKKFFDPVYIEDELVDIVLIELKEYLEMCSALYDTKPFGIITPGLESL